MTAILTCWEEIALCNIHKSLIISVSSFQKQNVLNYQIKTLIFKWISRNWKLSAQKPKFGGLALTVVPTYECSSLHFWLNFLLVSEVEPMLLIMLHFLFTYSELKWPFLLLSYGELFLISLENHTISYCVTTSALNATSKTSRLVLSL